MLKKLVVLLFWVVNVFATSGQTFSDCAMEYHLRFNKVQMQLFRKEIRPDVADSLLQLINTDMNNCILGKELPPYNFIGLSNKHYSKEHLRGKLVLLNFWSIHCGPCVAEIPVLNRLQYSYRENDDFVLLSILMEDQDDLEKFLTRGLVKRRIAFDVVPSAKTIMKEDYRIIKIFPTNLFIDKEGKIFTTTIGGIVDPKDELYLESKFKAIIDRELNK